MLTSPLKSETASFTNALKQVFYIHKNIVADWKAKLESVTAAYEELKQSTQSSQRPCCSCVQSDNLNRTRHKESLDREAGLLEDRKSSSSKENRNLSPARNEHNGSQTKQAIVSNNKLGRDTAQPNVKQVTECAIDGSGLVSSKDGNSEPDETLIESYMLLSRDEVAENSSREPAVKRQENVDSSLSMEKSTQPSSPKSLETRRQHTRTDGFNQNDARSKELRKRSGEKFTEMHAANGPLSTSELMSEIQHPKDDAQNLPGAEANGDGAKGHSRLRLTRHGKRRSRYIEGKPEGKRLKMSSNPFAQDKMQAGDCFGLATNGEDQDSALHTTTVLVPETEHTLASRQLYKGQTHDDQGEEESDSTPSQQMLVVPETMGMDYLSTSSDEEGDTQEDTVKENEEAQLLADKDEESTKKSESRDRYIVDMSHDRSLFGQSSDEEHKEGGPAEGTVKADSVSQNGATSVMPKTEVKENLPDDKRLEMAKQKAESSQIEREDTDGGPDCQRSSPKKFLPLETSPSHQSETAELMQTTEDGPTDLNTGAETSGTKRNKTLSLPNESENADSDVSVGRWITCQKDKSGHDSQSRRLEHYLSRKKTKGSLRTKVEPGRAFSIESFFYPRGQEENSPGNKSLRQTTMSQAFDVIADRSSRSTSAKPAKDAQSAVKRDEEDHQVAEAIRRSLKDIENQPVLQNRSPTNVQESEFKVPVSPLKTKSPKTKCQNKSPRKSCSAKKSPWKDENEYSEKKLASSPLRRSPRLLREQDSSLNSQDDPMLSLSRKDSLDKARKGLFRDETPENSRASQVDTTVTSDNGAYPTAEETFRHPQDSMTMCSTTPVELRELNQRESTGSQRMLRSSLRDNGKQLIDVPRNTQACETNRQTQRGATCDPNGSLNPDISLSEYLTTGAVSQMDRRSTMQAGNSSSLAALDETVAPNMVSQYVDSHRVPVTPGSPSFKHRTTPQKHQDSQRRVSDGHKKGKIPEEDAGSSREDSLTSRSKSNFTHRMNSQTDMDDPQGEWWNDQRQEKDEAKNDDDHSVVFTDDEDENETVAPSPQQTLQTQCSIPSSSRSFKFVNKHPRPTKVSRCAAAKNPEDTQFKVPTVNVRVVGYEDDSVTEGQSIDVDALDESMDDADNHSQEMKEAVPAAEKHAAPPQSLLDSFDRVPVAAEREIPHIQVVRKKSERAKLDGFSCHECHEYYKNLGLSEEALRQKMKECSRHKAHYRPPSTPEHFWSLGFPDTAEINERKQTKCPGESPVTVDRDRAPRRRKRLEKKF